MCRRQPLLLSVLTRMNFGLRKGNTMEELRKCQNPRVMKMDKILRASEGIVETPKPEKNKLAEAKKYDIKFTDADINKLSRVITIQLGSDIGDTGLDIQGSVQDSMMKRAGVDDADDEAYDAFNDKFDSVTGKAMAVARKAAIDAYKVALKDVTL